MTGTAASARAAAKRSEVRVHFLDMPASEALEARIRRHVARLGRFSGDVQGCEVWVASPHGHHRKGRLYAVRVRLTVPGEDLPIGLQPAQEDVTIAVREAFDAARRRLEDYERRRRGAVKTHPRAGPPRRRAVRPRAASTPRA